MRPGGESPSHNHHSTVNLLYYVGQGYCWCTILTPFPFTPTNLLLETCSKPGLMDGQMEEKKISSLLSGSPYQSFNSLSINLFISVCQSFYPCLSFLVFLIIFCQSTCWLEETPLRKLSFDYLQFGHSWLEMDVWAWNRRYGSNFSPVAQFLNSRKAKKPS